MIDNDDREALRLGHLFEELIETPAFKEWFAYVESLAQQWYKTATARSVSLDECIQREYEKGTLNGIELTLGAAFAKVAEMKSIQDREAKETQSDERDADDDTDRTESAAD